MDSRSLNIEKLFKASAVLTVFIISISIPLTISFFMQESAKNVRIKMDIAQLRNWAQVYQLENKNYKGFETDPELKRAFKDIEDMGGEAHVFVGKNYNSYCARADFKKSSWCVDDTGYTGKDKGVCSPNVTKCN